MKSLNDKAISLLMLACKMAKEGKKKFREQNIKRRERASKQKKK